MVNRPKSLYAALLLLDIPRIASLRNPTSGVCRFCHRPVRLSAAPTSFRGNIVSSDAPWLNAPTDMVSPDTPWLNAPNAAGDGAAGHGLARKLWRMGRPTNIPMAIVTVMVGAYAGAGRSFKWLAAGASVRWRLALIIFLTIMVTTTSCECPAHYCRPHQDLPTCLCLPQR